MLHQDSKASANLQHLVIGYSYASGEMSQFKARLDYTKGRFIGKLLSSNFTGPRGFTMERQEKRK